MFTGIGKQLTVFVTETDQYHHQALYMAIIEMLRREGCSGATAIRGVAGFGASTLIHTAAITSAVARSATRDHGCGQT